MLIFVACLDSSTWIKPKELEHVVFKPPTEKEKKQLKPQVQQNQNGK